MTSHRATIVALFALSVATTPPLVAAEMRLTDDPAPSTDPYVCSLGNGTGDLSVAWIDGRDGTDRVYFTRISPDGTRLLPDMAISDGAAAASLPSCGVDSAGNTHIVWLQSGALMYAKRSTVGGTLVAPLVRVPPVSPDHPIDQPHLDVEPGGNVHIVWVDTAPPRKVKYRKLDANGGPFGSCAATTHDTADGENETQYPFVMAPGSGNQYAFITWHGDDNEFEHLLDLTLPAPGCNDVLGPFHQTQDMVLGRTAMTENQENENAWLIWEGRTDTPLQHIFTFDEFPHYYPIDSGIGPAFNPSIAAISNSQILAVWEDWRYERPWIFSQAMNGPAVTGDNCRVSDGLAMARRPTVARAGLGTFAIVWDDDRHGAEEIYLSITGPTCSGFQVIDPNPDFVEGGELTVDPVQLADTAGREVSGFAADGVTPVLLRLPLSGPGTVTFDVSDGEGDTADVGRLHSPGGFEDTTTLQVQTDQVGDDFWAFAYLRAPDRIVRRESDAELGSRSILVRATFEPDAGSTVVVERTIDLKRPPVLLLHGLWGRSSSWGWDLIDDPRFTVYIHDYWSTHAAPLATNLREARRGVAGALELIRDRGFAATQVDAFGHSMGGLLLRKYRASSVYFDKSNIGLGDIHSLVTVDTPHAGSTLANLLLDNEFLHPLFHNLGKCVTCGAVNDLRPDSSEITGLPEAPGPVHAVVGKGGSDLIEAGLIGSLPREVRASLLVLRFFGFLPEDLFPTGLQHDLFVGRPSQEGRLGTGASQTSVFGYASLLPPNLGIHVTVAREEQVNDRAVELLNTYVGEPLTFASGFPAASGVAQPSRVSSAPHRAPEQILVGGIEIVSPANGTSVAPGIPLEVTVAPIDGYVPTSVLVVSDHDAAETSNAPYTVTLAVPEDAIGEIELSANALDDANTLATARRVRVTVDVASTLTALAAVPSRTYMATPPDRQQLTVIGHYDDGIERDLSASAMGTEYASSDTSVVTVDREGVLLSRGEGVAIVYAQNGDYATYTIVRVSSQPILLQVGRENIEWPAVLGALGYDVVRGDLSLLRGTQGFYELAIAECLANDWTEPSLPYADDPPPGEGHFFLMRSVTLEGARSYDAYDFGASAQAHSRDEGIGAATNACD